MTESKLNRDDMREAYDDLGRDGVSDDELKLLRKEINKEMKASGCFRGSFKMHQKQGCYLTCRSDYFEDREAVSFKPDGFVGFAGWADSTNVQPILRGFQNWMAKLNEHVS